MRCAKCSRGLQVLHYILSVQTRVDNFACEDLPGSSHPYSVHNMAQVGTLFGVNIGEWFQPSIIAKTLKLLVRKYSPFRCTFYYAHDRVIYRHNLHLLCTQTDLHSVHSPRSSDEIVDRDESNGIIVFHVFFFVILLLVSPSELSSSWRPVIIMAAVRLGVGESLNPMYVHSIVNLFRIPQCVGIIGGKPNASLYFVGTQDDNIFYLDPHFVQQASMNDGNSDNECHSSVLSMPFSHMDPCFVIGFLCSTRDDVDSLCAAVSEMEMRDPTSCVIGLGDRDPNYRNSSQRADPLAHLVFNKRSH
jgi:cysteine protease ATG4